VVHSYTINFGGDWRISRNVILNYGMRCVLNKNIKVNSIKHYKALNAISTL